MMVMKTVERSFDAILVAMLWKFCGQQGAPGNDGRVDWFALTFT